MLDRLDEPHHAHSLLGDDELHRLLVNWNETAADSRAAVCLHELFEAQVERTPESVALIFDGEQLTYNELNERANQLAHYLRAQGVGPDTLVGLCIDRSPDMVIAILGILKAGGAYVPLDPAYPLDRLDYLITDCSPALLLTHSSLLDRLPHTSVPTLLLDADAELLATTPVTTLVRLRLASGPITSPTSSTPLALPASPRALWSSTATFTASWPSPTPTSYSALPTSGLCSTRSPSTSRSGSCGAHLPSAAASYSSQGGYPALRRTSFASSLITVSPFSTRPRPPSPSSLRSTRHKAKSCR